ncbi:MAG: hypothetical protein F4123_10665 [Gemmatimonadetes bacterium]|nr:hypothetical protein [Gemmatimonadota bacterium]MYB99606.1 hypothetical protein [Gemmatimonadota bacterium]MYI46819.1 hypothetical protein [Gemmatimonadota bacterium]
MKAGIRRGSYLLFLTATLALQGCGEEPSALVTDFGAPWTTEPEFEFGESVGGSPEASFSLISAVRVLGDGDRILVVEAASLRATIWTPDGSLLRDVGRPGEGPGEFAGQFGIQMHRSGFTAIDNAGQRFTSFSSDGTFIESIPFPRSPPGGAGLGYRALLEDGSVFAIPKVSPLEMWGFDGNPPIESLPVVLLSERDGQWRLDTVAVLDTRNRAIVIVPEGTPIYGGIQSEQSLGDFDLTWFDPMAGSVVVVRRNLGPGEVDLAEIGADGETTWHRRLATPPVTLGPERTANYIDQMARQLSGFGGRSFETMRAAVQEALYVPDPLPGAVHVRGTVSGEIWFSGFERDDSLSAWYSLRRSDGPGGVRRILVPLGFTVMDATDTHVWGLRRDDLGVEYVAGRRLVPPAVAASAGEPTR